ncbi:MAG: hypothetical protein LBO73_01515 [Holosporaceae bacterium]|jgi:hypothetical protein|nr:hypothetical protein [Holosporaceae bacterium]
MNQRENALAARICHDLITPFNALNLGLEALEISGDTSLLKEIRGSVNKAGAVLKFMRELYSEKSDAFCYSLKSLTQTVTDFAEKYGISFKLRSDLENIPHIAGKIVMHNAITAKEIMPFGGFVDIKIDDVSGEIVMTCDGKNVALPNIDAGRTEANSRNIMTVAWLELLETAGFKATTCREEEKVRVCQRMTV